MSTNSIKFDEEINVESQKFEEESFIENESNNVANEDASFSRAPCTCLPYV